MAKPIVMSVANLGLGGGIVPSDVIEEKAPPPPSPEDPPTQRMTLDDFAVTDIAAMLQSLKDRPVQFLAKLLAAGSPLKEMKLPFPVGDGEFTHKTALERLNFEVDMARRELQGRQMEQEILRRRSQREEQPVGGLLDG
jgi:hypothetical protein